MFAVESVNDFGAWVRCRILLDRFRSGRCSAMPTVLITCPAGAEADVADLCVKAGVCSLTVPESRSDIPGMPNVLFAIRGEDWEEITGQDMYETIHVRPRFFMVDESCRVRNLENIPDF